MSSRAGEIDTIGLALLRVKTRVPYVSCQRCTLLFNQSSSAIEVDDADWMIISGKCSPVIVNPSVFWFPRIEVIVMVLTFHKVSFNV